MEHERNENAVLNLLKLALDAARDLPKLTLGAVGPDVTLPDAKALASDVLAAGETGTDEGRTAPLTRLPTAVGGGAGGYAAGRTEALIPAQLRLGF